MKAADLKAADLMVGDWVGVFDDKGVIKDCRQVDWIRTGEIGMRYQKVWAIGCIEPIQLTPEILEKNGLEKTLIDEEYCYSLVTMDYVIVIRTNRDGYWKYDSVREIGRGVVIQRKFDYVHELQHALRLCGLDNLADNFKV